MQKKQTALFDDQGVCLACRYFEKKTQVNWKDREKELMDILDRYRRDDGEYDVLVPGSGGKDSRFVSHILKTNGLAEISVHKINRRSFLLFTALRFF